MAFRCHNPSSKDIQEGQPTILPNHALCLPTRQKRRRSAPFSGLGLRVGGGLFGPFWGHNGGPFSAGLDGRSHFGVVGLGAGFELSR